MADRRKKAAKQKTPTITAPPEIKKKGREKKPTLTPGVEISDAEKQQAKPIFAREPKSKKRKDKIPVFPPVTPPSEPPAVETPPAPVIPPPAPARVIPTPKPVPEPPAPKKYVPPRRIRVLFVCTGNTCRSAMAQYIFSDYLSSIGEQEHFEVSGAGLSALSGDDMSEQAKHALFEMGITGINHFARRLTFETVRGSDLVVCMTEAHRRAIGDYPNVTTVSRITGGADVADPWGGSDDDYRKVAAYLKYACGDVYDAAIDMIKGAQS